MVRERASCAVRMAFVAVVAVVLGACGGELGATDAGVADASLESDAGAAGDADPGDAGDATVAADADAAAPAGQVCATEAGAFACSPDTDWTWTNAPVDDGGSCLDGHCPVGAPCDLGGILGVCE